MEWSVAPASDRLTAAGLHLLCACNAPQRPRRQEQLSLYTRALHHRYTKDFTFSKSQPAAPIEQWVILAFRPVEARHVMQRSMPCHHVPRSRSSGTPAKQKDSRTRDGRVSRCSVVQALFAARALGFRTIMATGTVFSTSHAATTS